MPSENVVGGRSQLILLATYATALVVAMIAAVAGGKTVGIIALVVAILCDAFLGRELRILLRKASLVYVARFAMRGAIVMTLLWTTWGFWFSDITIESWDYPIDGSNAAWVLLTIVAFAAAVSARDLVFNIREFGLAKPATTRNMGLPPAPQARAIDDYLRSAAELLIFLPPLLGGTLPLCLALALVAVATQVVPAFDAARHVLAAVRARNRGKAKPATEQIQAFLDSYRPEVIFYLSGQAETAYQVDVWLNTLEKLDQKVLVLLRKRALFDAIAITSLPVACVQNATDVIALDFASVKVGLYPAHVGDNIHLLRLPHIRSAFIGHGDSDKSGSASPFSRVYDEVWVAGPAGAQRYAEAGIEIDPHRFVIVGRPQISAISTAMPDAPRPSILYAPTWEAWADEGSYSSLLAAGSTIVQHIIDSGCRVIYKPHPMTGIRDPRFAAEHQRIVATILATDGVVVPHAASPAPMGESALERERLDNERFAAAWAEAGDAHVVVGAGGPDIVSCFNASHAMVSDVSSVLSDYLASEKPYAVFNPRGVPASEFAHEFPTATAATIVSAGCSELDEMFAVVVGQQPDTLLTTRHALAARTLGDDRSLRPFQRAVVALSARS
ncbi:hypothetical protein BH09ACT10_BH09ACT10_12380 [soil metagenome]